MLDAKREGRKARRLFSHAYMSDTKWRKLIAALDDAELGPMQAIVKFIDVIEPKPISVPNAATFHAPHAYIDSFEFGPFELSAIEWLEILAESVTPRGTPGTPPLRSAQDLDKVRDIILSVGQYLLEETPGGLRIVGYKR